MPLQLGQIPEGDVLLDDGRVLRKVYVPDKGTSGWEIASQKLSVLATIERDWPAPWHVHLSIRQIPDPTPEDIAIISQAFFGDMPIDDSQLPEVREAAPGVINLRPRGWRGSTGVTNTRNN